MSTIDPVLDAAWKDDSIYATCSSDQKICIARVGETKPQLVLHGHSDAINSIRWDASRTLLASCSDDYTVKIWDPSRGSTHSMQSNDNKDSEIATVQGSTNLCDTEKKKLHIPEKSAEKDSSIGSSLLVHDLKEHTKEVYTIRWSGTGTGSEYPSAPVTLASASFDATVKLWDVDTGSCTQTFTHS